MKKIILLFFLLLIIFSIFPVVTKAASWCAAPAAGNTCAPDDANCCCDESNRGATGFGLVPCGRNIGIISRTPTCSCQLYHLFFLIMNVYKFVIWTIALPLAGLLIMIGGVLLIFAGGFPRMHDLGKNLIKGAIWGLFLILGSWLIISIVLKAIGYQENWFIF